jgi:putative Holliday junction resolvase
MYDKKIIGLDLGDVWVGIAIADSTAIISRPLCTIQLPELLGTLKTIIPEQNVGIVVVGYPKTCSGTISEQTKKIISMVKKIKKELDEAGLSFVQWKLWDERMSSKWAQQIGTKRPSPEEKRKEHARAAAFILQNYLDSCAMQTAITDELKLRN